MTSAPVTSAPVAVVTTPTVPPLTFSLPSALRFSAAEDKYFGVGTGTYYLLGTAKTGVFLCEPTYFPHTYCGNERQPSANPAGGVPPYLFGFAENGSVITLDTVALLDIGRARFQISPGSFFSPTASGDQPAGSSYTMTICAYDSAGARACRQITVSFVSP